MRNIRIEKKGHLPAAPVGDRVLLLQDPPMDKTEYGIIIPDEGKLRPSTGVLLSAGLAALDKLYDNGIEMGDHVMWGKFAGVIYEWDHLLNEPKNPCEEHNWTRGKNPRDRTAAHTCDVCGADRLVECVILANVDDIQCSVGLEERKRAGAVRYKRAQREDNGATQHIIIREES